MVRGWDDAVSFDRVLIIQPYIPEYRVPLFSTMKHSLAAEGIDLSIAAGSPGLSDYLRGDDCSRAAADFVLTSRTSGLGSRKINYRNLRPVLNEVRPGLVIVEQAIKNLETWQLMLSSSRLKPRIAMWGQGRTYSAHQSRMRAEVKQWLTRKSDWFFAYTHSGADYVIRHGFDSARTTVLNNATDTARLKEELSSISDDDVVAYGQKHGLVKGRTALFLGGVDERKGIEFLLRAAKEIAISIPDFRLLVGGAGSLTGLVQLWQDEGAPVIQLGRIDGRDKALAIAASDVIMIPEWIGLIAVDALTGGIPVVTTNHPSHSPEAGYLVSGVTSLVTDHDVNAYAGGVVKLLCDSLRLRQMSEAAGVSGNELSIESMARNFTRGVTSWRRRVLQEFD